MGYILYYSSYCIQCQRLLRILNSSPYKSQIHFICVDARRVDPVNGKVYIISESGSTPVILPSNIQHVPAIILISQGNRIVFGVDNILASFDNGGQNKYQNGQQNGQQNNIGVRSSRSDNNDGYGRGNGSVSEPGGAAFQDAAVAAIQKTRNPNNDFEAHQFGSNSGYGVASEQFSFLSDSNGIGGKESSIPTPTDDYSREKMGNNVTIDKLIQQRNADLPPVNMPGFTGALPPAILP